MRAPARVRVHITYTHLHQHTRITFRVRACASKPFTTCALKWYENVVYWEAIAFATERKALPVETLRTDMAVTTRFAA